VQISLQLPRDLEPDFGEFKDRVAERIESGVLSIEAVQLLARFGQLVYTQVAQLSLVARGDRTVLYTRHILDGIPLAIVWPGTRVTILESREKKAGFLERAVRELGIRNVTVACGRLEEYGRSWTAEPHRAVYVRALGDLPDVLRSAERVAVPGAEWIYFLGADTSSDLGAFGGRLLRGYFPPGPAGARQR